MTLFRDPFTYLPCAYDDGDAILDVATDALITVALCDGDDPGEILAACIGWQSQLLFHLAGETSNRMLALDVWAAAYEQAMLHLEARVSAERRQAAYVRADRFFKLLDDQLRVLLGADPGDAAP